MIISRKTARLLLFAGIALAVVCARYPVHDRMSQAGLFAGLLLVWGSLFVLLAPRKKLRAIVLASPLLLIVPFVLPGRPFDPAALRADYVARMRGLDGTRYVYGGENSLGIDCSGLPRKAFRDALWSEGWHHANGTAFRMWLAEWWFDASALAMREGYRGRTRSLGIEGPLWVLDKSALLPGDLAVRGDGGHVVAYLGGHEWIEADPTRGKVHIWIPTPGHGGCYEHMTTHRWVFFERSDK